MAEHTTSLQGQIARANSYYQELCDMQKSLQQASLATAIDLTAVQKTITKLCATIIAATKKSHVGAPQAIAALQQAMGELNLVYELLGTDLRCDAIPGGGGMVTGKMIHVEPGISAKRDQLAQKAAAVAALAQNMMEHANALESQQSVDMDIYRSRAETASERLLMLSQAMDTMVDLIQNAHKLYQDAQLHAIALANQIPY